MEIVVNKHKNFMNLYSILDMNSTDIKLNDTFLMNINNRLLKKKNLYKYNLNMKTLLDEGVCDDNTVLDICYLKGFYFEFQNLENYKVFNVLNFDEENKTSNTNIYLVAILKRDAEDISDKYVDVENKVIQSYMDTRNNVKFGKHLLYSDEYTEDSYISFYVLSEEMFLKLKTTLLTQTLG